MSSVLYDAPGPRARRRNHIITAVGGLALLGLLIVVYRRLDSNDIFDWERWNIFFSDSTSGFRTVLVADVWSALGRGLLATLKAAAVSAVLACLAGAVVAGLRLSQNAVARSVGRVYVELFRGLPVLLLMFFPTVIYTDLPIFTAVVIGLTLYNSAVIAEILRSGVVSLPRGQREAAAAIGLRPWESLMRVELPQAVRIMLPALISQVVVLLKDTSLGYIVGYEELLQQVKLLKEYAGNNYLFSTFFVGAAIYILTNFTLSMIANRLAKRGSKKTA